MQVKLGQVLRNQRHKPCVMGSRRELRKNHLISRDKKFDTKKSCAPQTIRDLLSHFLSLLELLGSHSRRHPRLLIVATLLAMSDRIDKKRRPLALLHRQQSDLQ